VKIRLLRANSTERGEPEKPHALVCNEVRGGNRKFIGTRELPGIAAWVASISVDEDDRGGDLHFMSVCGNDNDVITRVALADVSGHGQEVDAAAMTLHTN
jgi:sigma-B regulation protein RsbU (phosphoserine phosphatase)